MTMDEVRRYGSFRFNTLYSGFPRTYHPCNTDDFISDELSGYKSTNYLEFDEFRNGSRFRSRGRRPMNRGRWSSGQRWQNRGSYNSPERRGRPHHHGNHEFPDQHIKNGGKANPERPDSQESTSMHGPDLEPGPVSHIQETVSLPKTDLRAQVDVASMKREKKRLKRQRQKAQKAAAKAQAGHTTRPQHSTVTSQHADAATAETQQSKAEGEDRKRKEKPSAAEEPKLKVIKMETSDDSTNRTEPDGDFKTASNSEAVGQSSVLRIEEELAQLKVKFKKRSSPLHDSEERSTETTTDQAHQKRHIGRGARARVHGYVPVVKNRITARMLTFKCQVCNFRSFYKAKLEAHLKTKFHNDHFRFLNDHLSHRTVDFLKTYFSDKQQKVQDFVEQIPDHRSTLCQVYEDRDLTQDISMEHFIRKEEAAHCLACDEYIPMQNYLIQSHLRSPDHQYNCKNMMVQSKHSALSTVQKLLQPRSMRWKLELFLTDCGVRKDHTARSPQQTDTTPQEPVNTTTTLGEDTRADMGAEPGFGQVKASQGNEAEGEEIKRQIAETVCVDAAGDGKDLKEEPLCGHGIETHGAVTENHLKEEPLCRHGIETHGAVTENHLKQEPLCGHGIQTHGAVTENHLKEELLCGHGIQTHGAVTENHLKQEPLCGHGIQTHGAVTENHVKQEPLCGQLRETRDITSLSESMSPAPDDVIIKEKTLHSESACVHDVPAAEILQENKKLHLTGSLLNLLDEDDALEGVELGEEEMEDDDL